MPSIPLALRRARQHDAEQLRLFPMTLTFGRHWLPGEREAVLNMTIDGVHPDPAKLGEIVIVLALPPIDGKLTFAYVHTHTDDPAEDAKYVSQVLAQRYDAVSRYRAAVADGATT